MRTLRALDFFHDGLDRDTLWFLAQKNSVLVTLE